MNYNFSQLKAIALQNEMDEYLFSQYDFSRNTKIAKRLAKTNILDQDTMDALRSQRAGIRDRGGTVLYNPDGREQKPHYSGAVLNTQSLVNGWRMDGHGSEYYRNLVFKPGTKAYAIITGKPTKAQRTKAYQKNVENAEKRREHNAITQAKFERDAEKNKELIAKGYI